MNGEKVKFSGCKIPTEAFHHSEKIKSITVESTECPKCKCKSFFVQFLYPIVSYWNSEDVWDIHIMTDHDDPVQCLCSYCSHGWKSPFTIESYK